MYYTKRCKEGDDRLEATRDEDTAHLAWFEVQVKGVELRDDKTILLLEKCGNQGEYVCEFAEMRDWLEKHNSNYCINKLAKVFVYAQISLLTIIQMKTFKQSMIVEEKIYPQDWSASSAPVIYRSHAPFRGRESGGIQKCPNCGANSETIIVRTGTRVYHKCMRCCALMETVGGAPFS